MPRVKSYRELEPRRQPPKWGDPKRLYRITTDDTEFQLCQVAVSDRDSRDLMAAYRDRHGKYQQVIIDRRRIRKMEVLEQ